MSVSNAAASAHNHGDQELPRETAMSEIKTVLVAVSDDVTSRPALELACQVGRKLTAHVLALHVKSDPSNAVPLVGEGMSGVMVEEMIAAAERQADERARAARSLFDDCRAKFGAPLVTVPDAGAGFSVAWREEVGREEDVVARCGRLHDLIVYGRPLADSELPSLMTLNAALMESGRPLLVAPSQGITEIGRKVAVAWNGSAESARAVKAALVLLQGADSVVVLAGGEQDEDPVLSGEEVCAYLAWHGIGATCRHFQAGVTNTGEALDRELTAMGADLLVMGAYTHSRLRQLILGGVTRHMLHHATIPVLMMH